MRYWSQYFDLIVTYIILILHDYYNPTLNLFFSKVTEADFIAFLKKSGEIAARKTARLRETTAMFRRWLLSGE